MKERQPTPYKRVISALHGYATDKIPFTMYENKIPRCTLERELRNRGLCIVKRVSSYRTYHANVNVKSISYKDDNGRNVIKTVYSTPYGEVSNVVEPAGFTSWKHEFEFKTPDDYKSLLYIIEDIVIEENYSAVLKALEEAGEDFIIRDSLGLEPLNSLISGFMGVNNFSMEWMDNRDEILKLYEAFVDQARKIYPIVANGPLEIANYGGNVIPNVVGVQNFKKLYVPHYNEAAEILHKKGKLIGSHMDADNTIIMDAIADTALDYIEAYDPSMSPSIKEVRKKWPDKALWINWPSAWHLNTQEEVYNKTIRLLDETGSKNGFIIGITEDVPEDRWKTNYKTIMDAIDDYHLNDVNSPPPLR